MFFLRSRDTGRFSLHCCCISLALLRQPPNMVSKMDTAGDTASLKRKREPKDDLPLSQKKHRRRSKSKLQDDALPEEAANSNEDQSSDLAVQQINGDVELVDASSQPPVRAAPWKLSKPMGGRMLDIDPVYSLDERYGSSNMR